MLKKKENKNIPKCNNKSGNRALGIVLCHTFGVNSISTLMMIMTQHKETTTQILKHSSIFCERRQFVYKTAKYVESITECLFQARDSCVWKKKTHEIIWRRMCLCQFSPYLIGATSSTNIDFAFPSSTNRSKNDIFVLHFK